MPVKEPTLPSPSTAHPGSGTRGDEQRTAGGPREEARRRTQERLLDGALVAVARHGLGKLSMRDVSAYARVSRATAYRYFPDTDSLLRALGRREASRFERQVWEALEKAPAGRPRLRVVLDFVDRLGREHPLIQRLPETDPGTVLTALRERFPELRDTLARLLGPILADTDLVRSGTVSVERLAGWATRMLISFFLFPEPRSEPMSGDLAAVYELLASGPFAGLPPEEALGPEPMENEP